MKKGCDMHLDGPNITTNNDNVISYNVILEELKNNILYKSWLDTESIEAFLVSRLKRAYPKLKISLSVTKTYYDSVYVEYKYDFLKNLKKEYPEALF